MSEAPLRSLTLESFLDALAAKSPTPGGGSAAGLVGATSAALAGMVVAYSLGKKDLAAHQGVLQDAAERLARARRLMLDLADEDAAAYGAVNELSRLPPDNPRRADLPAARLASVQVPLVMLATCADLLRLMESLSPITNRHLRSDLAIAATLAQGAAHSAFCNIRINAEELSAEDRRRSFDEGVLLAANCKRRAALVEKACA